MAPCDFTTSGTDQAELRRAFDMFDANHDGMISKQELWDIATKLRIEVSEEELTAMLDSVDGNRDGLVDFSDFNALYTQHLNGKVDSNPGQSKAEEEAEASQELKEAFAVFDKDKDGFITPLELHSVLCDLGLKQGRDMVQIKNMIRSVDADGDGKVNFQEFRNMMSKALTM